MADWILTGSDFSYLTDAIAQWLAYGIGLGAICWMVGVVVWAIINLIKY